MNNDPIMIDQYHIDIASTEKLTRPEVAMISKTFADTEWLKLAIRKRIPLKLEQKLLISITR